MTLKVCPTPGCPNLTSGGPCSICAPRSARNHRGIPRQARGLGADHERARLEVLGGPCVLELDGCTGVAESLEHTIPRSQGGTLADGYGGGCLHCQRVQGAALARAR